MSVIYLPSELKESRVPSFASLQQDFTPLKPGKPGGWRRMQSFAHLPGRVLLNQLWCPRLPSLPSTRQHFPQFHQRSSNTPSCRRQAVRHLVSPSQHMAEPLGSNHKHN